MKVSYSLCGSGTRKWGGKERTDQISMKLLNHPIWGRYIRSCSDESRIISKTTRKSWNTYLPAQPCCPSTKDCCTLSCCTSSIDQGLWGLGICSAPEHVENWTAGFLTAHFTVYEHVAFQSLIICSKLTILSWAQKKSTLTSAPKPKGTRTLQRSKF